MGHVYRFFGEKISEGHWKLDDDEVTHALKVLRLEDGEMIEVMNGKGLTASGKLHVQSKSKASAIDVTEKYLPQDSFARSILIGALKPGDIDDLIAPLVELGVDQIIVFRQDDTPHFRVNASSHERWQRLVRSAIKQSKRPWLVTVEAFESLDAALVKTNGFTQKWLLSPDGSRDFIDTTKDLRHLGGGGIAALIGGEKGLSEREESLALHAGFDRVRLGPWILRARTAAPAAAVFLGMLPRQS